MADPVVDLCATFTKVGLEGECKRRGLSAKGSKTEMARRIVAHTTNTATNDERQRNNEELHDGSHDDVEDDSVADDDADEEEDSNDEANDDVADDDSNEGGSSDGTGGYHNDDADDDKHSSDDASFRTAVGSTRKPLQKLRKPPRPYSFRDVEDSIESFSAEEGQNVKEWILQFEEISAAAYWNDEQKLIMLRKKLTGTARRFVFTQRNLSTFGRLKKALIAEFAPFVRASDVHRQLAARKKKPTEPIRDYIYEMQRIALAIDLDEPSLCEYIVDGVTDDEYHRSMLYDAHTIKKLKEKLLTFEKTQAKSNKKSNIDDRSHQKRDRREQREEKKPKQKSDEKRHCFNCGDTTHVASECPQRGEGPKCFSCNGFGHLSKECDKKGEERKKKSAKVNTIEKVNNPQPDISVKLNDRELRAIVDTGSEISLIRKDLWLDIEKSGIKLERSDMRIRGYGGEVKTVCGEVILNTKIEEEDYAIRFYVVPSNAIDMQVLIGMDFLVGVNYSISPDGVRVKKYPNKAIEDDCDPKWIRRIEEYSDSELTAPYQYRSKVMNIIENYKPESSATAKNPLIIKLVDNEVVRNSPRRLAPLEREVVRNQLSEWLENGIVQQSDSQYASAVVVVPKKDGSRRVCVDFREVNKKVVRDNFPIPNIEEQIDQLCNARVYTTLDLKNSYFHVPVEESSRKYTAFVTSEGQFEFLRAPFGLCTSGSAFGRFISEVFKDLINDGTIIVFVDDVIIPSETEEEGIVSLEKVLKVAERGGLVFNWKKCVFLQRRVEFLGYTIYDGRVEPAPAKIEKLKHFPQPTTVKQLQRFYGLASYFRKFIPSFADIARPLSNMLKKDSAFIFDEKAVASFGCIKNVLASYPVLRIFQPNAETEVHTDASKMALAGILMQRADDDGKFHPCYYYSRLTSPAEQNYHSYDLEALAVVESVQKFRCYLLGCKFKIVTDCMAFKDSMMRRKINARVARWAVILAEFDYEVEHRSGNKMPHVDALSRSSVLALSAVVSARMRAAQNDDERVKAIKLAVEQNGSVDGYTISNGVLYKDNEGIRRVYVPEAMEMEMIRTAHDKGHFGVKKTRERIDEDYYIPGIEEKIKRCIAACIPCIVGEKKRGKPEGELLPIPKGDIPMDTLHIDHLGPMPSTKKSYNYVLTVIDAFTKFVWLFATKSTSADEVIRKLRIITDVFGNPRRIICDRGAAFTSTCFNKFCEEEGIELHTIVTGVPRGNGQVERVHRIIIPMLTKLSVTKPDEWFKHVVPVQRCLNDSWQRAIQTTPFQLLLGVKMRTKQDEILHELLERETQEHFERGRYELRQTAREGIQRIQQENRKHYNFRRKPTKGYKVGDVVAIPKTQFGVGQKVKQRYFGPYEIVNALPNDRYEVRKLDDEAEGPKKTSTAGDCLKPWSLPGRK